MWSLVSCLTRVVSCLTRVVSCLTRVVSCLLSHACVLLSLVSRVWSQLFVSGITTGIEPSPRPTYPLAVLPTLPATRYIYTHIAGTEVENERAVLHIHKVQEDKWRMRDRVTVVWNRPRPSLHPLFSLVGGEGGGGGGRARKRSLGQLFVLTITI